jgi:hypothetical protein
MRIHFYIALLFPFLYIFIIIINSMFMYIIIFIIDTTIVSSKVNMIHITNKFNFKLLFFMGSLTSLDDLIKSSI